MVFVLTKPFSSRAEPCWPVARRLVETSDSAAGDGAPESYLRATREHGQTPVLTGGQKFGAERFAPGYRPATGAVSSGRTGLVSGDEDAS